MKKRMIVFLSLLLVFALAACNTNEQATTTEPADMTETETITEAGETTTEATGAITAGTYTSTIKGMNADIEVTVVMKEDAIESVTVTSHEETPGIGGELKDMDGNVMTTGFTVPVLAIPERIVAAQSVNVDSITGATITSGAIKAAVTDCIQQAGGNPEDWKAEVPTDVEVKDYEADVVVVGGGGAGLAAAISAAEQGKTVVILEKNGALGGDTLVCGAIYNTPNEVLQSKVEMSAPVKDTLEKALAEEAINEEHAALQAEVQKQWDEYNAAGRTDLFDSKEWFALQTWNGGDKVGILDLVKKLTFDSFAGFEWINSLGMKFNEEVGQGAGALWQRTHTSTQPMGTGFMSVYSAQLDTLADKITVLTESTATDLIMDGDRVVGAKAINNMNEEAFEVRGTDGVILATGGFAANGDMVQEYNTSGKWGDLSKVATTNRWSSSQGDGITMALQADASLTDMEQIQLLYLGNLQDGQLTKYPPRDVNGTDQIIFINKEGERFVNEGGRRDEICLGVIEQTDSMFYMLESGDGEGYVDITDPNWVSGDGFSFEYLKENGFILVGDTLEDLATQIGCDPATLQKTVDTFNASVDSGQDEFGRTLYSVKLENGPWVATPRQASLHHTMGGVTIDTEGRILNEAGEPIPGFYAGGEVTGGIHGANRLGGNAVVDTVVFGKLAADTLVKDSAE